MKIIQSNKKNDKRYNHHIYNDILCCTTKYVIKRNKTDEKRQKNEKLNKATDTDAFLLYFKKRSVSKSRFFVKGVSTKNLDKD